MSPYAKAVEYEDLNDRIVFQPAIAADRVDDYTLRFAPHEIVYMKGAPYNDYHVTATPLTKEDTFKIGFTFSGADEQIQKTRVLDVQDYYEGMIKFVKQMQPINASAADKQELATSYGITYLKGTFQDEIGANDPFWEKLQQTLDIVCAPLTYKIGMELSGQQEKIVIIEPKIQRRLAMSS